MSDTHYTLPFYREKETDNRKAVRHLVATLDCCDGMSLVSYNSVRDCNPSATPKTVPEPAHYQLGLLPQSTGGEELKVHIQYSLTYVYIPGMIN